MIEPNRGPEDDAWRELLAMAGFAAGILVVGIGLVLALVWAVFRAY